MRLTAVIVLATALFACLSVAGGHDSGESRGRGWARGHHRGRGHGRTPPTTEVPVTTEDPSDCPGDSTDPCACPETFERCAGRCYHLGDTLLDYTAAEQYCADRGAILAVPRTQDEHQCTVDTAKDVNVPVFWLGYRNNTPDSYLGADGDGMTFNGGLDTTTLFTFADNCVVQFISFAISWIEVNCQQDPWRPMCQILNCDRLDDCPDL